MLERTRLPGSLVELVGSVGIGKTTLLQYVGQRHGAERGGGVEYFTGKDAFSLSQAIDPIAERFRVGTGRHLLLVDDAHALDRSDTMEAINRLATGPWDFSTIIASQYELGIGPIVELNPFKREHLHDLLAAALATPLDAPSVELLWNATRGNPSIARELSEQWRRRRALDPAALARLLEPWSAPGLVDTSGRPLRSGAAAEKQILADVEFVGRNLLERIAASPRQVFSLTSAEFEELAAELLAKQGYEISLTPRTRDGGKDMYAAKREKLGSFLYVVECKRWAPDRPVGVGIVRALHGVTQHERVNAGILLTTSSFTQPALAFAEEARYQLSLRDYFDLRAWIDDYQRPRGR